MTGTSAVKNLISNVLNMAMRLHALGGPLWKTLTFSAADDSIAPGTKLCIAIEKSVISAAYGTRLLSRISIRGLKKYPSDEQGYPRPREVASSAALAVREFGVSGADVTLSIPKAWVIIKTASFPATIKENIADAVAYELDRLMPFSPDDAFYDFRVIGEEGGKIILSLAAAKADPIKKYINELKDKGINVSSVTVNLSGIGSLCRHSGDGKDCLFVEVNEDGYEGALYVDGALAESFSEGFASADEKSKIETIAAGAATLLSAAKNRITSPRMTALVNDKNAVLKEMLRTKMGMPVTLLDETDLRVSIPGRRNDISYAAAGGVVESLWLKAKGLNLLKRGRYGETKTPVALTALLMISLIVIGVLYLIVPLDAEKRRLREIERQITIRKSSMKDIEALRNEIDELNGEVSSIRDFKDKNPLSLIILKELSTILPRTAWLTRVRLTATTVEIEGYASSATDLLSRLEASKYLRKAEFGAPIFKDIRMNSDRFIIKMEIEGLKESGKLEENKGVPKKNEKK